MPTDAAQADASRGGVSPPDLSRPVLHLLLFSVLAAPAALGAADTWVWAAQVLVAALALLLWSAGILMGRPPTVAVRRIALPALLFAAAMGWAAVQAGRWTPAAWHHPLWPMAADALGRDVAGAVSLAPADGWDAILRLCGYATVFYLALNICRDRRMARRVLEGVALATFLYAAYGVAAHLSGAERILWMAKTSYIGDLTSTFVNRNTFAAFAGLGLVCQAGLLMDGYDRAARGVASGTERRRLRGEFLAGRGAVLMAAAFVTGTAILLTHSRAGLACTVAAAAILFLALALSGALRVGRVLTGLALAAGLALALFAAGGGAGTGERLLAVGDNAETRMEIYRRSAEAVSDAPWLGGGFGAFAHTFRLYRSRAVAEPYTEAHNSYLESVVELGLPAGGALILAVACLPALCAIGLVRRRRALALPAVGLAASTLVGLHAVVDYSIQNPAVASLYVLIMGAACAQSWSSRTDTAR